MRKILLLITLVLVQSCEFRYVVSANFAKEYCSCLFVVKRSEDNCYEQSKQFVTPNFKVRNSTKEVTASFLLADTVARYDDLKYGCILDKSYLDK
ncbi:hypothetical protein [Halobacteriovorax sp. HLS]|uniref:hypothetical protein n=1 Tax=Halobacteriovorax sp. HLS TaxID=2234000 RepID=UPI000FD7C4C6|nr:hypothetical protein [Halobacteriovorax sp. HLS]